MLFIHFAYIKDNSNFIVMTVPHDIQNLPQTIKQKQKKEMSNQITSNQGQNVRTEKKRKNKIIF